MTFTLSPETEAQLTAVAALRGLPLEETLAELVAQARAASERERQLAIEGVRRSEEDFAAGRWVSLDELDARLDALLEAKRREASPQPRP